MSTEQAAVGTAAWDYIARGLRVIALTGKAPNTAVHRHGLKDAFDAQSDPAEVHAAFLHPETTGVGILTDWPYYVVDIDGPEGAEAWMSIAGTEVISDTWTAKTGRGLHIWFADMRRRTTTKLGEKLDLKAEGGYVAAPPSMHPDGHRYEWLLAPADVLPMEAPATLMALLNRKDQERSARITSKSVLRGVRRKPLENGMWYPVATFAGIIDRMKAEPEGNRNGMLYWAAATMLEEGADEEDIEELLDAAIEAGLQRREARRTIRSAYDARG